jgi:ribosomal protein S27E
VSDNWTDGNSLGGPLREIFSVDITAVTGRCSSCGTTGPLAEGRLFGPAPGLVLRCPHCGDPLLRMTTGAGRAWLDLRGRAFSEIISPG